MINFEKEQKCERLPVIAVLPQHYNFQYLVTTLIHKDMIRILFVCHGNICRSPMAEFILKALVRARGLEGAYCIESAAISDEEYGNPIYPPAKRCLTNHGVWFDPAKTARTITRADYDRFDRIVCMDSANLRYLCRMFPSDPQKKVHMLMSYTGFGRDVADPWYTGDFETAFQDILEGCEAMLNLEPVFCHETCDSKGKGGFCFN